jgi:hypothetical protein
MDCYPPVYYLAQAVLFKLAGFGIVAARAASALFVAATALLCFAGGRRLAGPAAGFLSMAMYLLVPTEVYVLVARPDVAAPFFLLGSVLVLATAGVPAAGWRLALAGMLCALAVLSHFVALMALPVVAALAWRAVGLRFWRSAGTWAFAFGAMAPGVAYAAVLHPHYLPTLEHFVRYADVGLATAATSAWEKWPLRPTLQHLRHVGTYLPSVAYGLLPAAALLLALGTVAPAFRARLTDAGWLLCASFLGMFVAVGAYPNISVYGYYGPLYLAAGAVVAGMGLLLPLPRRWAMTNAAVLAGAAVATAMAAAVVQDFLRARASVRDIPLLAALDWTAEFPRLSQSKVLASAHWVFSSAAERTRVPGILDLEGGRPVLSRAYRRDVPDAGEVGDFGAVILDKWNEYHVPMRLVEFAAARRSPPAAPGAGADRAEAAKRWEQMLRRLPPDMRPWYESSPFAPIEVLVAQGFRTAGVFHDDARVSSAYTIFERGPAGEAMAWPRLARATPAGAEPLGTSAQCAASVEGSSLRGDGRWAPWLSTRSIALGADPRLEGMLLAVRIVMDRGGGPAVPLGFATYHPDASAAEAAKDAIASYRAPSLGPDIAMGLLGVELGAGKVGRVMLVEPGATGAGVLAIHLLEARPLERVDFAVALPAGRQCDEALSAALGRVVAQARAGP